MSARLRAIAQETEGIVAAGGYRSPGEREVSIAADVRAARDATTMFGPAPVPQPPAAPTESSYETSYESYETSSGPSYEVTGESSLEAAHRLTTAGPAPVAVLNFASARNPGGGYLNGAQAQEEALCRASALYACLTGDRIFREFYEYHRADRDPFYTDRVIHSPAVPVFRDDRGRLLDTPYTTGFLTAAAPNAGVIRRRAPDRAREIPGALAVRAERVLETAAAQGYRRLVLGAWGCGVFQNDPSQVVGVFRELLVGGRFTGHFREVVFAVLDRTQGQTTRATFERTFAAEE